ncbi:hypothetical protein MST27_10665 [Pseudomonas sp. PS1]|uniref:Uncharacterized protein n=1 Tax=Stutzerimonas marianensis TaxID=2929513 RepID=A0A9X1W5N2_9GAMM|nr:hypothetical protein [Pseudomonas marianensis]MCJ0973832.1 hypothetical protein [Pseudomonas marianensis]
MSKADDSLDLCSLKTFAGMAGVSVEEAADWAATGTIPTMRLADFRMVNLARLRADLGVRADERADSRTAGVDPQRLR